jgi:hypothetical protein
LGGKELTIKTGESSASYSLCEAFLGGQTFNIDKLQYVKLNDALDTVVSTLEIEELFQVFAQSFLRFEKDLLDVAFEFSYVNMKFNNNEEFFSNVRHRFNVSIITILTAFKSYDDHCNRILKYSINPPETKNFNCETRREIFDNHLSYRICAMLRDYAQHRALPLGGYVIGGVDDFACDDAGITRKLDTGFNVSPWLNVSEFKSSSQCKPSLQKELDHLDCEKIDMKWLIRSFAGAMYKRHALLRTFLTPKIEASNEQIATGYNFASAAKGSEAQFLELRWNNKKRPMRNDLGAKVFKAFETYESFMGAERLYVTSKINRDDTIYCGQDER